MPTATACPVLARGACFTCLAIVGLLGWSGTSLAGGPLIGTDEDWLRRVRGVSGADVRLVVGSSAADTPGTLFLWYDDSEEGGPDLDEPIVTDRPDFTEASSTVGVGVLQIESGYTYSYNDDGGVSTKSHSYPETLLRYGVVANWLELRLAWNYSHEIGGGDNLAGAEDLYLGMKLGLSAQDGILPEMALVPQMTVPTGAAAFSTDEVLPGVNWLYGWDINDYISTAGSTQVNRGFDDVGDEYTEWAQSWTVGYSLADDVGAYTEWFALFPYSSDAASTEHYFNGGITYYLTNDIMWDIRSGVGLNDAADDYFVGTGLSIRFH